MKKLLSLVLALAVLLGLSACSSGGAIRYDLSAPITNLDPQFTTDPSARLVTPRSLRGCSAWGRRGRSCPPWPRNTPSPRTGSPTPSTCARMPSGRATGCGSPPAGGRRGSGDRPRLCICPAPHVRPHRPQPVCRGVSPGGQRPADPGEGAGTPNPGVAALDDNTLQIRMDQPDSLLLQRLPAS